MAKIVTNGFTTRCDVIKGSVSFRGYGAATDKLMVQGTGLSLVGMQAIRNAARVLIGGTDVDTVFDLAVTEAREKNLLPYGDK